MNEVTGFDMKNCFPDDVKQLSVINMDNEGWTYQLIGQTCEMCGSMVSVSHLTKHVGFHNSLIR